MPGDTMAWDVFTIGTGGLPAPAPLEGDTTFHITALSCSPNPVVRTSTITCTASWNPLTIPVSEIMFDWQFESDSVMIFPDPTAQRFAPPAPVDSAQLGLNSWSGPAVVGGKARLIATWQGDSATDSTAFAMTGRTIAAFGDVPVTLDLVLHDIATDTTKTSLDSVVVGRNYDVLSGSGGILGILHATRLGSRLSWWVRMPGTGMWRRRTYAASAQ